MLENKAPRLGEGERVKQCEIDIFSVQPARCSAQLNQDTFLKEFCSYSIGDRSPLAV